MRSLLRDPVIVVSGSVVALAFLVALLPTAFAPHDPLSIDMAQRLQPPSSTYPVGTDEFGRDLLSRVLHGTRSAVMVGITAVLVAAVAGTILGMTAGYLGGWWDTIIMRPIDALMAFPSVILAIALIAVLGPSLYTVIAGIAVGFVPPVTRLMRSQAIVEREKEYVEAARATGARTTRILGRHILPNSLRPLIVQAPIQFAWAISMESGLSFLGIGLQPPAPSWGLLLSAGRRYMFSAWWYPMGVIAALVIVISALTVLSERLMNLNQDGNRQI